MSRKSLRITALVLALIVALYRKRQTTHVEDLTSMKL